MIAGSIIVSFAPVRQSAVDAAHNLPVVDNRYVIDASAPIALPAAGVRRGAFIPPPAVQGGKCLFLRRLGSANPVTAIALIGVPGRLRKRIDFPEWLWMLSLCGNLVTNNLPNRRETDPERQATFDYAALIRGERQ